MKQSCKGSRSRIMPARKRRRIHQHLLNAILKGQFAPGTRLPTRRILEAQFEASTITVQTAVDKLRRDGFVYTDRRNGTFVASKLPFETHFALAFRHVDRAGPRWSLFYQALTSQAAILERETDARFPAYHGVDEEPEDNSVRRRLLDDVLGHRLAGIIFTHKPFYLDDSPLLTSPSIPRVLIGDTGPDGVPCLSIDVNVMLNRALDALLQQGRKRIAVIMPAIPIGPPNHEERLNALLAKRGLEIPPYWKLQVPVHPASAARDIAHLLISGAAASRPDGVLIADDNLTDGVCAGLMAAGVFGTGAVEVVAHTNFRAEAFKGWPIRRIGGDPRAVLMTCISVINMQRRGETPPHKTVIPPLFEDELAAPEALHPEEAG